MSGRMLVMASRHALVAGLIASVGTGLLAGAALADDELATSAIDDYGACLAAHGEGDLVLLIDESGSLQATDPRAARVTAATYLLNQMASTAESSGFRLDVAVAGFSADFEEAPDWTTLDDDGLPTLLAGVESFADRDHGLDTDYWTALEGARQLLADHRGAADTTRCQAIAWFSDGQLDIEARTTERQRAANPNLKAYAPTADLTTEVGAATAEAAARESLCRDGGLADQVRVAGVAVFGVGLTGGTQPPDFNLMKAIATGSDGESTKCGAVLSPTPGEFYPVSDIDDMLFAFDRMSDPSRRPIEQTSGVCQTTVCAEAGHRFVLDSSIRSVHVLGSADVDGLEVVLVAPSGAETTLTPDTLDVPQHISTADVDASFVWQSPRTVVVDMTKGSDPAAWTGAWSLVFVDPTGGSPDAVSRTNIHIAGDIYPAWTNPDDVATLHTGEVVPGIRLGLVDASGAAIDPQDLLGSIAFSAKVIARDGSQSLVASELTADQLAEDVAFDLTALPQGGATLRLDLEVTTAPATTASGETEPGTALTAQRLDVPITLAPPVDFPEVAPTIDFGTFEGRVDAHDTLPVSGPGCIWIDEAEPVEVDAAPAEIGDVSLTTDSAVSQSTCLTVEDGEDAALPLALTTETAGNGALHASLAVHVAPLDEPDRATTVEVVVRADLRRPINPTNYLIALATALILGPGIPVALLYVLKRATARIPARALAARHIPVTIADGQILREGIPFTLRDSDLIDLVNLSPKGARTASADGVELRTATGGSPFGVGYVRVVSPGRLGASSDRPEPVGRRHEARLPLAVHNTWVLLHDPAGPEDAATVLVLAGADSAPEHRDSLVDDLTRRAPDAFTRLREVAPPVAATTGPGTAPGTVPGHPDDPFGSRPPVPDSAPSPFAFADGTRGPDLGGGVRQNAGWSGPEPGVDRGPAATGPGMDDTAPRSAPVSTTSPEPRPEAPSTPFSFDFGGGFSFDDDGDATHSRESR